MKYAFAALGCVVAVTAIGVALGRVLAMAYADDPDPAEHSVHDLHAVDDDRPFPSPPPPVP